MAEESFDQNQVTASKFYMLRCVIAMAHADGIMKDEEQEYIQTLINNNPFSDEQRETLAEDLSTPQNAAEFLEKVTEPEYRGQVIYFARLMAFKDNDLDPSEEALLDYLRKTVLGGLDMDKIRAETHETIARQKEEWARYDEEFREHHSLINYLKRFFGSF